MLSYWKNSKIIKSIRINYLNIYVLKSYKKYKLNYIKWLIYVIKKKIVNNKLIKISLEKVGVEPTRKAISARLGEANLNQFNSYNRKKKSISDLKLSSHVIFRT